MAKRKPKGESAIAPTAGSALADASNLTDDEQVDVPVAFMGFYSKKSNRASEVKSAIPGITDGAAFVCYEGDRYARVEGIQVMDTQYRYFSKSDSEGQKIAAGPAETPETPDENILAVVLVYTADAIIPTVTEFRKTKVRCVRDFISAAARTQSDGWAERQGPIGQQLASLGARLRIIGQITLQQKTAKSSGNIYHLGRCACSVLNDSQVQLLIDAMGDDSFDENLRDCISKATGRWNWLQREFFPSDDQ
jgi:hypothetical protein